MNVKEDKAFTFCFKEMFLRVGEVYPNEELTKDENWYRLRSWTTKEEESFCKWMVNYLRKKLKMRIQEAEKNTAFFVMMYGWAYKGQNTVEIIKGE